MLTFMAKICRDPGDASGGVPEAAPSVSSPPAAAPAAAPAVPAAPAAPAPSAQPSSPPASPNPAAPVDQGSGAPGAAAPAAVPQRRIDSMPLLDTPDFIAQYHRLTPTERAEVDASVAAIRSGKEPAQGAAQKAAEDAQKAADEAIKAALPGDDPAQGAAAADSSDPEIGSDALEALEAASEEITPDVLATLPESVQKALQSGKDVAKLVRHLDAERQKYGVFATETAQESLKMMAQDPVISRRMTELAKGGGFVAPAHLATLFEPGKVNVQNELQEITKLVSSIGSEDESGNVITADPAKIQAQVEAIVKKAFLAGARDGDANARTEAQAQLRQQKLKEHVDRSLLSAAEKYPELKSTDPNVTDPWDKRHPLNPIIEFAKKNEMGKLFTDPSVKNPGEAVIAAYQAANGGLQKAFKRVHDTAIKSVIRNVDDAAKRAALTVGRSSSVAPQAPVVHTIPGGGVDMERLARDPSYGASLYHAAMARGDRERAEAIFKATQRRALAPA